MAAVWRLITDEVPGDGVYNMAVDRAIQCARATDSVPPTLRLYTWSVPTVSLGRFQDEDGIDRSVCAVRGLDLVRRFTGGRGVLHDDEVTYSVIASTVDGVPRGVAASYRYLCTGLAEAYRILGVGAGLTRRERGDATSAACYLHATTADLSTGSRKLAGSAQVWLESTVLQHGSFTITRDLELEAAVFRLDERARQRLAERTATLADQLGTAPSRADIVHAASTGFARALGIVLEPGSLTADELAHVRTLQDQVRVDGG